MTSSMTISPAISEHPLRNANYQRWLTGTTISLFGDQFYLVAMPWLVLQQTGSALAMGTIMMCGAIPRAVLMLMGGVVSDRFSPRKIMMGTASARTLCVTAIGLLVWFKVVHTWELYALAVAFGIADAFAAPAGSAFLPFILKREQLVQASSVSQSIAQVTMIAGPAPAGFAIKALGLAWAFFIDAISFVFIIGALLTLPDPPKQATTKSVWQSILEGIDYVRADVPLRSLMLLAAGLNFCLVGPISIGLAYITKTRFGTPTILGVVLTVFAAGGLGGATVAGMWQVKRRGVMILTVSFVIAICLGSIGLLHSFWMLLAVLLLMGLTAGMANVHLAAWIMQRIDVTVRGRVSSVLMLSSVGLMPVSLAVAGLLTAWNVTLMYLVAAGLMLLITCVAALKKSVREIA